MYYKKDFLPAIATVALVIAYFFNSGIQALYADEPTRALCALEMIIRNDWIPTINGEVYVNKPPLYNWILLGFFKVFGFSEWVVRFPAILSLILFGILIFYFFHKITGSFNASFFSAAAVLTAGNILFYSSLLGHIDALFSLIVFLGFMIIYNYGNQGKWSQLFAISYFICFVGFMLKGIPAIVFQGISLVVAALFFKSPRILFSRKHIIGSLWFIAPTLLYLWAFSYRYPLSDFVLNLWEESSKRTIAQKSLSESILHLFTFPLQFLMDTAPWSLIVLVFIKKHARTAVWENQFLRFCLFLFLANIAIYWLAPDNRARYVLMLYPLFFILLFSPFFSLNQLVLKQWLNKFYHFPVILFPLSLLVFCILNPGIFSSYILAFLLLFVLSAILLFGLYKKIPAVYNLLLLLILCRLGMDMIVLPERIKTSEFTLEKKEAMEIVKISANTPLAMYCSNLHHNSTYYITLHRNEILGIVNDRKKLDAEVFYLLPSALLSNPGKTTQYYSFIRRHENMPFSLVKVNSPNFVLR